MTPQEFNRRIDHVIRQIGTSEGPLMVKIGSDALKKIKDRVIETGTDAEGQKYEPYSTKPMLANYTGFPIVSGYDKIAGSKEKRRDLKWVTLKKAGKNVKLFEIPGGYKQFRELENRRSDIVNFSFTNDMWNDISIISNGAEHNSGVVKIGAKEDINKKKLAGNTKRRGDILDLSESEIDDLKKLHKVKILEIFKSNGI